jgi:gas vesicle protein
LVPSSVWVMQAQESKLAAKVDVLENQLKEHKDRAQHGASERDRELDTLREECEQLRRAMVGDSHL